MNEQKTHFQLKTADKTMLTFTCSSADNCKLCREWVNYPIQICVDRNCDFYETFCLSCVDNLEKLERVFKSSDPCDVCQRKISVYKFSSPQKYMMNVCVKCMEKMHRWNAKSLNDF